MKLSTRSRYGLKAVFILAIEYGEGPVSLKRIAAQSNLSITYLEQLFMTLRNSNIVRSVRGSKGGYVLNRSPDQVTIGEVLRVLEGDLAPSNCIFSNINNCENFDQCNARKVWIKINKAIDATIDSVTLADMLNEKQ